MKDVSEADGGARQRLEASGPKGRAGAAGGPSEGLRASHSARGSDSDKQGAATPPYLRLFSLRRKRVRPYLLLEETGL